MPAALRRIAGGITLLLALAAPGVAQSQNINSVAGTGVSGFSGDGGSATSAMLSAPSRVARDAAGNFYIADTANHRIRRVAAGTGDITTVAGTGNQGFAGDGGPATSASLFFPEAVAVGPSGDLYIADTGNSRIRKIAVADGIITTVAGNGAIGYAGDGGVATAASLYYPSGIAVDSAGNFYFSDSFNHRVRVVSAGGTISTVAGNGTAGYAGDGGLPTGASLYFPSGLALATGGTLYVADSFNHRVRRIGSSITTVAGNGVAGFAGDGGAAVSASLLTPEGVALDALGSLFVADSGNNRIRVVAPGTNLISTVAGTGGAGGSGDGGPALAATLNYPKGLETDASGNLLLADKKNHKVRKVNFSGIAPTDLNNDGKSDLLYRNTATGAVFRLLMNGLTVTGGGLVYTEGDTNWVVVGDADFNGDGVTDILYRHAVTGQVSMLFFNADGVAIYAAVVVTEPSFAWMIAHTPDLDGDGKADLLWWNSSTGEVYAMMMNGAQVASQGPVHSEPNTAWKVVATGDFSGSGKTNQLLWRNSTTGEVFLMTVTVSGWTFSQAGQLIYQEANTDWKIIGAADFNGDGKSDILWRNQATGEVYMMLMNGAAIATQGLVYQEANTAWKIVAQGDYNGDGKADLLWRNDATGQVYMMLMNGLAVASEGMAYGEPDTSWVLLGPGYYGAANGLFADAGTGGKSALSSDALVAPSSLAGTPRNPGSIGGTLPAGSDGIRGAQLNRDHGMNDAHRVAPSHGRARVSLH